MATTVYIGIGSNIGNLTENCITAMNMIVSDKRSTHLGHSSLYLTSAVSPVPQPDFINGAIRISWSDSAQALLDFINDIEHRMGRQRNIPGEPRIIDLDILLFGKHSLKSPTLSIPHPRFHTRKFAIIPCLEIDSELMHPCYKKKLSDFLHSIEDTQKITLYRAGPFDVSSKNEGTR